MIGIMGYLIDVIISTMIRIILNVSTDAKPLTSLFIYIILLLNSTK